MSNDDCITIDSSSDECQVVVSKPSKTGCDEKSKVTKTDGKIRKVELTTIPTGKRSFSKILTKCKELRPSNETDIIVNKMWKRFHEANSSYTSSSNFVNLVEGLMDGMKDQPFSQLKLLSDELKLHRNTMNRVKAMKTEENETEDAPNRINGVMSSKTANKIDKLERTMAKIHRKIAKLEEQEVDFSSDDEGNSAYVKVSRYKQRICQIFDKICELRKLSESENPLRPSLRFTGTNIKAIDRALTKFYIETKEFPDYRDVLNVVNNVNERKSLAMKPDECQTLARAAFKKFGKELKRRRQYEFEECLSSYLRHDTNDPAKEDVELKVKLEENEKLYRNRIDDILNKYAELQQDKNIEPEEVPSDAPSETDNDDERNEENEAEDCISLLSDSESDVEKNKSLEVPERYRVTLCLSKAEKLPEWHKYAVGSIPADEFVSTVPIENQMEKSKKLKIMEACDCEPVAGCSKYVPNNCCERRSLENNEHYEQLGRKRSTSQSNAENGNEAKRQRTEDEMKETSISATSEVNEIMDERTSIVEAVKNEKRADVIEINDVNDANDGIDNDVNDVPDEVDELVPWRIECVRTTAKLTNEPARQVAPECDKKSSTAVEDDRVGRKPVPTTEDEDNCSELDNSEEKSNVEEITHKSPAENKNRSAGEGEQPKTDGDGDRKMKTNGQLRTSKEKPNSVGIVNVNDNTRSNFLQNFVRNCNFQSPKKTNIPKMAERSVSQMNKLPSSNRTYNGELADFQTTPSSALTVSPIFHSKNAAARSDHFNHYSINVNNASTSKRYPFTSTPKPNSGSMNVNRPHGRFPPFNVPSASNPRPVRFHASSTFNQTAALSTRREYSWSARGPYQSGTFFGYSRNQVQAVKTRQDAATARIAATSIDMAKVSASQRTTVVRQNVMRTTTTTTTTVVQESTLKMQQNNIVVRSFNQAPNVRRFVRNRRKVTPASPNGGRSASEDVITLE